MEPDNGASAAAEPERKRFTGTRFSIGSIGIGGSGGRDTGDPESETAEPTNTTQSRESVSSVKTFGRRKSKKTDEKIAQSAAAMVVGSIETFSVMRYGRNQSAQPDGNDGRLIGPERKMLTDGIAGTLASLPTEITEQVNSMSAPVMAALGILLYLTRVSSLESRRRANAAESRRIAQSDAVMQAQNIVASNGAVPTVEQQFDAPMRPMTKDELHERFGG